jgi:hypothetical protein
MSAGTLDDLGHVIERDSQQRASTLLVDVAWPCRGL